MVREADYGCDEKHTSEDLMSKIGFLKDRKQILISELLNVLEKAGYHNLNFSSGFTTF